MTSTRWDDLSTSRRAALLLSMGASDTPRMWVVARTGWLCLPDDVKARLAAL